jgi:hypothetical protein
LFLAEALTPLGIRISIFTDADTENAIKYGLKERALANLVPRRTIQPGPNPDPLSQARAIDDADLEMFQPTHLLALERVGPNHESNRYVNMRGVDITRYTGPADLCFERIRPIDHPTTIGIGDGGNEIGMGKIPRKTISRNIPNGDRIACRVATDFLIVAGISNWGAYALAAGVRYLRGVTHDPSLFDPQYERELLEVLVESGPLVDGTNAKRQATVDGLSFEEYAKPLIRLGEILRDRHA